MRSILVKFGKPEEGAQISASHCQVCSSASGSSSLLHDHDEVKSLSQNITRPSAGR
jgi:hypothetical protein